MEYDQRFIDHLRFQLDYYSTGHMREYDPPLDEGIRCYVEILNANGIETVESCQGGPGHSYTEPTIRFLGDREQGFRAFALAYQHQFPVSAIRRSWRIIDGEPVGPEWEMTFYPERG